MLVIYYRWTDVWCNCIDVKSFLLPSPPFQRSLAVCGLAELFQPRSAEHDETVDSFFQRRLGPEVLVSWYCIISFEMFWHYSYSLTLSWRHHEFIPVLLLLLLLLLLTEVWNADTAALQGAPWHQHCLSWMIRQDFQRRRCLFLLTRSQRTPETSVPECAHHHRILDTWGQLLLLLWLLVLLYVIGLW